MATISLKQIRPLPKGAVERVTFVSQDATEKQRGKKLFPKTIAFVCFFFLRVSKTKTLPTLKEINMPIKSH